MPEILDGGAGTARPEQPHEYKAEHAFARASDCLEKAVQDLDRGDWQMAKEEVGMAAIYYCDLLYYANGHGNMDGTHQRELRESGFRLAEITGSEGAQSIFQPPAMLAEEPGPSQAESPSSAARRFRQTPALTA